MIKSRLSIAIELCQVIENLDHNGCIQLHKVLNVGSNSESLKKTSHPNDLQTSLRQQVFRVKSQGFTGDNDQQLSNLLATAKQLPKDPKVDVNTDNNNDEHAFLQLSDDVLVYLSLFLHEGEMSRLCYLNRQMALLSHKPQFFQHSKDRSVWFSSSILDYIQNSKKDLYFFSNVNSISIYFDEFDDSVIHKFQRLIKSQSSTMESMIRSIESLQVSNYGLTFVTQIIPFDWLFNKEKSKLNELELVGIGYSQLSKMDTRMVNKFCQEFSIKYKEYFDKKCNGDLDKIKTIELLRFGNYIDATKLNLYKNYQCLEKTTGDDISISNNNFEQIFHCNLKAIKLGIPMVMDTTIASNGYNINHNEVNIVSLYLNEQALGGATAYNPTVAEEIDNHWVVLLLNDEKLQFGKHLKKLQMCFARNVMRRSMKLIGKLLNVALNNLNQLNQFYIYVKEEWYVDIFANSFYNRMEKDEKKEKKKENRATKVMIHLVSVMKESLYELKNKIKNKKSMKFIVFFDFQVPLKSTKKMVSGGYYTVERCHFHHKLVLNEKTIDNEWDHQFEQINESINQADCLCTSQKIDEKQRLEMKKKYQNFQREYFQIQQSWTQL